MRSVEAWLPWAGHDSAISLSPMWPPVVKGKKLRWRNNLRVEIGITPWANSAKSFQEGVIALPKESELMACLKGEDDLAALA